MERYKQSVAAGNSIILAPNHSRLADPLVLGQVAIEAGQSLFAMASWHVFKQSRFQTFMTRRMGAFSVLREGNDRQAIETAIDIMVSRRRPLIVFPEGGMTRHNDVIEEMMDGPSFIARQAAKRLKKEGKDNGVVIHPVAEETVRDAQDQLAVPHRDGLHPFQPGEGVAFAILAQQGQCARPEMLGTGRVRGLLRGS